MKKLIIYLLCMMLIIPIAVFAANKSEELIVLLDKAPSIDHAPLIIAAQQGYFKEQGLKVKLIESKQQNLAQHLINKQADIGLMNQPLFMEQVDQGAPLIRIGTLIEKPLNCIAVLDDSGIKSLADLKGKNVATNKTNTQLADIMLNAMLATQGISSKDFTLAQPKEQLAQALLHHKIDAISGLRRNFDIPQLEKNGHKIAVLFPEEHGIPNYSQLIFITHLDNRHNQRFPRFLAAIRKAVIYLDEHPQLAWQHFIASYPHSNTTMNRQAWFNTIPYFAEDPEEFNGEEWQSFANFMLKSNLIKKVQPITRYST